MVFYKSGYPPAIRPWLKLGPSMMMGVLVLVTHPIGTYLIEYKAHEHYEKPLWRSNRLGQQIRERNDNYRFRELPLLNRQPGQDAATIYSKNLE